MNRLTSLLAPPVSFTPKRRKLATVRTCPPPSQAEIQTFTPLHYEPNYDYPLLVWLHDDGGEARDLQRVMPLISMRNYVGVSLTGDSLGARRGWGWQQTAAGIVAAENKLADALEQVTSKFRIHPDRIFLAGNGVGGTLATRLALRNPERFSGALSLGGAFPTGQSPLSMLSAARRLPLFIAHCRDSEKYPTERLCEELKLFHAAGIGATIRQYPCGDEVTTQMLHDMDVWLMERVTGCVYEPSPAPIAGEWN
jgi:phospholipase/carboxylesterase